MSFTITASNPKGLPFDYYTEDPLQAREYARAIKARGGKDLKINGKPVPDALLG